MGVVDRRLELIENIARLRRAGRESPGSRDISAVRAALERELGDTVSRRLAARVLGVSHTALNRWIKAGDLPMVESTNGRSEVPVAALLDLRDSVETDRLDGPRRYALTPAMTRQHAAARRVGFDLHDLDLSEAHGRSLAYHRALARRLSTSMIEEARHTLFRWREERGIDARGADLWDEVLNRPLIEIRRTLREESPEADDLRERSPFAGLLSEPERRRIVRAAR